MSTIDGNASEIVAAAAAGRAEQRSARPGRRRRGRSLGLRWLGWLFALPAAIMYAVFVLAPLASTIQYSFYDWNGIGASTWVGIGNYVRVFTDPDLLAAVIHSFVFIIFFSLIPVAGGLVTATLIRDIRSRAVSATARVFLFLPQIIPAAGAAVAWTWIYSNDGALNQFLRFVGLGDVARPWLGDFDWALPAVGIIGTWLSLGLCTVLLLAGIGKIDASLYEAVRLDGAGWWRELFSVTLPGLRAEIGVCITITTIAALASFDVVFLATQGGPGKATTVPGVEIYLLGFTQNRVGLASALAIVLMLLVLIVVGPIQRLFRERS
ncbi:sugar ABC transporter permease [Galbitalea sp. SE-J8]|uniref:carbohydrate ABC transporter permease n=1 Tax=Galbitalea sp. SE-J8 TaxID=3054952 RepID=UPI00259C8ECC|nr:sugar ABC transporter permease [Galbitalea sp. SE-J8]MDM4762058.1 sugar ABC transporter permease [Galbitalea sp. SE-J8]